MLNETIKKVDWHGNTLLLSTGKIARYADGSVLVSMGNTSILCTVVFNKAIREDIDFFPLSVHYREMSYAAGKIPGGFIKKEGKFSDSEILTSRLIDRSIRPLFDPNFRNETQVICTVMSYDHKYHSDVLAIIGSIAALAISGIPIIKLAAAARVGLSEGKLALNPTSNESDQSILDLVVTATSESVTMIEAKACEIEESKLLEAIELAHDSLKPVIKAIEELKSDIAKSQFVVDSRKSLNYHQQILQQFGSQIKSALLLADKADRYQQLELIESRILDYYSNESGSCDTKSSVSVSDIKQSLHEVKSQVFKDLVLNDKKRIGGNRAADEIRPIVCEIDLFNRVHGSALFTRGGTQSLATVTLGGSSDEQIVEQLSSDKRHSFLLDYIFPPYAVGETSALRASSRREIGHGWLANKALQVVIPEKTNFPYTVRVVSEITQSDGSSSMATVCSASLCLMSAGVPIKSHVAGIAMGVVIGDDANNFAVLSDISACEDHLGDMDFKVAGTKNGITALQLDVKVHGISMGVLSKACEQARSARQHILKIMNNVIDVPRSELSSYAPLMQTIEIPKDKIREVIGTGGKVIKDICKSFNVEIDVSEDGMVKVWGGDNHNVKRAIQNISDIAIDPRVGDIFDGEVVRIIESGAFVRYIADKDGFLHISEIQDSNVVDINDHLKVGDKVKVKIVGFDRKNRIKLSLKLNKPISNHAHSRVENDDSRNNNTRKRIKPKSADRVTVSERKYFD